VGRVVTHTGLFRRAFAAVQGTSVAPIVDQLIAYIALDPKAAPTLTPLNRLRLARSDSYGLTADVWIFYWTTDEFTVLMALQVDAEANYETGDAEADGLLPN